MNPSVSILLGAGFSAPVGYPVGDQLNQLLLNCKGTEFGFHTSGVLCVDKEKGRPDWGYKTSYDLEFDFCLKLMHYYHDKIAQFDYEEFYDYLLEKAEGDPAVKSIAKPFLRNGRKTKDLVRAVPNIYNQMVSHYLVDREGKKWYDDEPHMCRPIFPGYTGILNCLERWGNKGIVHIHTLNHDLFFERLAISDWLQGELCDGFQELGSPYYGKLHAHNRTYKARLPFYSEKYDKKFRLYKLHGSRDYGLYYGAKVAIQRPQVYLKTRYGVGFGDFYKEIDEGNGKMRYEDCRVNYHTDFLTGTTSKIKRHKEPLLYKTLFHYLCQNLEAADQLVIPIHRSS